MIRKQPLGFTPEHETILSVTLSAGPFSVEILSLGGIIRTLKTPDRNGKQRDIVLGFGDPLENLESTAYFGQIVGRFANRIAGGRFAIDGTGYRMDINDGKNCLHSGKSNFGWRNWHVETFEWSGDPGVVLSLMSPDGDGGMPGALNVTVTYLLRSNGELRIEYDATTTKKTIVNMTNHSYFNLGGAGSGNVLSHEVKLACDRYLEVDRDLIPTGRVLPVAGTPFDFTKKKTLGKDIAEAGGYDHCFVLVPHNQKLFEFAQVYEPVSGRTMKVSTTLPAVQMYTGNFLDGSAVGKGKVAYPKHGGVCFETQFFPDSPNHPGFPSCILDPDGRYKHTTVFSFGAR
jgi:aldose 1-epimerase